MSDIESPTRDWLRKLLTPDFLVHEGWSGWHKHEGEKVLYDLVIEPRPHLIERGFDRGWVVVEVKLFNHGERKKPDVKIRDMLWQCVSYSYSQIELPAGGHVNPLFTLYYLGGTGLDARYQPELTALHHFVQRGGVGSLEVNKNGSWSIRFGGSFYYRSAVGKGPHHVGTKRQIGSAR